MYCEPRHALSDHPAVLIPQLSSDAAPAVGSCGTEITRNEFACDEDRPMKTVLIPGYGCMDDFSAGQWPWSEDARIIVFKEGITGIGARI